MACSLPRSGWIGSDFRPLFCSLSRVPWNRVGSLGVMKPLSSSHKSMVTKQQHFIYFLMFQVPTDIFGAQVPFTPTYLSEGLCFLIICILLANRKIFVFLFRFFFGPYFFPLFFSSLSFEIRPVCTDKLITNGFFMQILCDNKVST